VPVPAARGVLDQKESTMRDGLDLRRTWKEELRGGEGPRKSDGRGGKWVYGNQGNTFKGGKNSINGGEEENPPLFRGGRFKITGSLRTREKEGYIKRM